MKPGSFTYHRPAHRDEVDALLEQLGDEAKILAGGQSLVPIMSMRLAAPAHIIDINHLEDEPSQPAERDGTVACAPLVRHEAAERSQLVANRVPLLAQALRFVAHPAIRSRGTVAGSIAHSDPAAELPAVLVALGGEVGARSAREKRTIAADDFFVGPLESSLSAHEWVSEVRWPTDPGGFAFEEFARRAGDYALCGVAAAARRAPGGTRVVLAYLGMGDAPMRLEIDGDEALEEAVRALVAEHLDAPEDIHASSAFRAHLARRLGTRAAHRALEGASAYDVAPVQEHR
jgi:carbon-monoxide dehydrogenase medium subunit